MFGSTTLLSRHGFLAAGAGPGGKRNDLHSRSSIASSSSRRRKATPVAFCTPSYKGRPVRETLNQTRRFPQLSIRSPPRYSTFTDVFTNA